MSGDARTRSARETGRSGTVKSVLQLWVALVTQILFSPSFAPVQSDYSTHCLLTAVATNLAHQPLWWCTCRVRPRISASTAVWRASVDWWRSTGPLHIPPEVRSPDPGLYPDDLAPFVTGSGLGCPKMVEFVPG